MYVEMLGPPSLSQKGPPGNQVAEVIACVTLIYIYYVIILDKCVSILGPYLASIV